MTYYKRHPDIFMSHAHNDAAILGGMEHMANRIRAARKAKGLSQVELAKRVGTDQGHISRIENNAKGASIEVLADIAHELGMTLSQLIGDDQRMAEQDYGSAHPVSKILKGKTTPEGLRELAADSTLVSALEVSDEEWLALNSVKLPGEAGKDGYVQLLMTIRNISTT